MRVNLQNDKGLDKFISTWDAVMSGIKEDIPEDIKEQLFDCQLRNSEAMRIVVAAYERAECAKLCELVVINACDKIAQELSFAIHARGEK